MAPPTSSARSVATQSPLPPADRAAGRRAAHRPRAEGRRGSAGGDGEPYAERLLDIQVHMAMSTSTEAHSHSETHADDRSPMPGSIL